MKRDDYLVLALLLLLTGILIYKRWGSLLEFVYRNYPIVLASLSLPLILKISRRRPGKGHREGPAHLVKLGLGREILVLPFTLKEASKESLPFDLIEEVARNMGVGISLLAVSLPRTALSSDDSAYAGFIWAPYREGGVDLLRAGLSAISSVSGVKFEELELNRDVVTSIMRSLYSIPKTGVSFKEVKLSPVSKVDPPFLTLGVSPSGRPVRIDLAEMTKHTAIMGQTGSGKTTTVKRILWELWLWGIPFIVLDFHWEYRGFIASLGGVILGEGDLPCVNPLSRLGDMEMGDVYLMSEMLSDVLELTPSQFYILSKSLMNLRERRSVNLRDLVKQIESYKEESQPERESKASLLRKLTPVVMSDDFKYLACDNVCVEELMVPTVIELGHLKSDKIRQLFVHFLLKRLRDAYLSKGHSKYPRLVVVFEESEKVLPSYRDSTGLTATDRILSEMRKFGLATIVVTQAPSEVSPGVLRNTGIKVLHRMSSSKDLRELKFLIESKDLLEEISKLREGEVLISSTGRVDKARIVPVDESVLEPESLDRYARNASYLFSC